ncbi:unnamed protein product [Closterium sp. NIES-54]
MQLRRRPTLTPRQLREWLYQRGPSLSLGHCPYVIRTGRRAGETCGTPGHAQSHYSAYLTDAWRTEFGDEAEIPPWLELLRSGVSVFALDYDAILTAMSALPGGAESECHLCVQYDPGIEVAALGASEATALGASESASSGTAPAEALHTFTLESGATHCFFFCDSTALTPLSAPVVVSLADPSWGRVLARSTTVLPCPAVPSGSLTGFHLPSFSTNLVRNVVLQDQWVDTFTPGGQRVAICTCTQTGCHLATFTRRPGSSLYTLTTAPPQVAATGQVSASGQVASFSHQTLFWHHRLGHPSLPRLCDMHRRLLESSLPISLPPLPASPTPPCLPCVEGRKRAAPHSSSFPPTEAPLQTLHLDVWGPVGVRGQGGDWFFLLVVDDYSRYTTLFPLRTKGEVPAVLIPWIRAVRLRLCRRFCQDLPVLRLHSDRGGEFTSDLLRAFCQGEGIEQSFTLPGSPQQNEVAERRIGLVMEVACTSLIHAAAPHLLWLFALWLLVLPAIVTPGSLPAFKARYVARGFSQRQGVDYFQTFPPTPKMTTLRVLLHVAAQRDYELHSLDFSIAFLQGILQEEIWLRRPPGFTESFPAAPPSDESVEPSGPYPELVGCLITSGMGLVLGGQDSVVLTGHSDASWADDQATQRSSKGYTFSLGSGSVSWRSTPSELRWVTYLLTDLGERPRSPPILYVDNKAMLALCHKQRLEHRTKHTAFRYFLARELQQRRHLQFSYVALRSNTADVFIKALGTAAAGAASVDSGGVAAVAVAAETAVASAVPASPSYLAFTPVLLAFLSRSVSLLSTSFTTIFSPPSFSPSSLFSFFSPSVFLLTTHSILSSSCSITLVLCAEIFPFFPPSPFSAPTLLLSSSSPRCFCCSILEASWATHRR